MTAAPVNPASPHTLKYLANCSTLFTEFPLLERPAAAKAAGFDAVEFWWPFDRAVPSGPAVRRFVSAIHSSGVKLVGLNFYAGDLGGGDFGLVSIPARTIEFRDSVDAAVDIGQQLHVEVFNALYGNRIGGLSEAEQDHVATENLHFASRAVEEIGARVLVEPISGQGQYPLRSAADVNAVLQRVRADGCQNVRFLFDIYHLATNGEDIASAIEDFGDQVGHVQVADVPGRGEPGSGHLDIGRHLRSLSLAGYHGWVSLEYRPTTGNTRESLRWLR